MPDNPLDIAAFAAKVRAKTGDAYSDVDDATLVKKVVAKYPVYADKINVPVNKLLSDTGDLVDFYSNRNGIDPELTRRVISQESSGNPRAHSRKGAAGYMQ